MFIESEGTTQNNGSAQYSFLDGVIKDLEYKQKYPQLVEPDHVTAVDDIHAAFVEFTGFTVNTRRGANNHYRQTRGKVGGDINGPATTLVYYGVNQMSFAPADLRRIYDHLAERFPDQTINIHNVNKPKAIIHIAAKVDADAILNEIKQRPRNEI